MNGRLKTPRLVAVAVLGFLLLNSPLLTLADSNERVLGVPVLHAYVFVAWAAVIALVGLIARRSD